MRAERAEHDPACAERSAKRKEQLGARRHGAARL